MSNETEITPDQYHADLIRHCRRQLADPKMRPIFDAVIASIDLDAKHLEREVKARLRTLNFSLPYLYLVPKEELPEDLAAILYPDLAAQDAA